MLIIGHRGARGLGPENTLASLHKALEHHADRLEIDLRVTKDHVAILHHHPDLFDGDGQRHRITNTTYQELKRHKPDLVTLDEALKLKTPFYLEVKAGEAIKPIATIIKDQLDQGRPAEDFWLGSKDQPTLLALNRALPDVPKIVIESWSGVKARWRARQVDTKLVCMNQRWLWWGFIRGFKHSDWQLFAYTVNDVAKARRWEKYGLAGIVTDYPDLYEPHP